MKKFIVIALFSIGAVALAESIVQANQGAPNTGKFKPWPVTGTVIAILDGGKVVVVGPDGGGVVLDQPVKVVGADGGNVPVNQGLSRDGGVDWPVLAKQNSFPWLVAGADGGALNVNVVGLADGGSLNVTVTNTVNVAGADGGTLSVIALGPDGGAVNVTVTNTVNVAGADGGTLSVTVVGLADGGALTITGPAIAAANDDGTCPSGAASFTVRAAFSARRAIYLWASPANTDDVFVKLGTTATSSDARLGPGQAINFDSDSLYTGRVDAFPASGTQAVCVVEL